MKSSTAISILAAVSMAIVGVRGDAVSCSVIDYLYYSSDCCDNSNSVQCMESIPQTDKAAIDNLASLKRPDGSACQSGDSIKFTADTGSGSSGIVCADANSCIIPCENGGTISGTVSGNDCTCTCPTGLEGPPACTTPTPCPACLNGGTATGSVAGGDCGCDCSATGGYTGDNCENAPPPAYVIHETYPVGYNFSTILTEAECRDLFDNHRHDIGNDLNGNNVTALEAEGKNVDFSVYTVAGAGGMALGCSVQSNVGTQLRFSYNDGLDSNGDEGVQGIDYDTLTTGGSVGSNRAVLLLP